MHSLLYKTWAQIPILLNSEVHQPSIRWSSVALSSFMNCSLHCKWSGGREHSLTSPTTGVVIKSCGPIRLSLPENCALSPGEMKNQIWIGKTRGFYGETYTWGQRILSCKKDVSLGLLEALWHYGETLAS